MDLPSTLGVPRIVYIGGRVFWVRPITLEAMAIILAWLDDVLPGRAEREALPLFNDDASQEAIESPAGRILMLWLALRDHGVSYDEAVTMEIEDVERVRLLDVLYNRRRSLQPSPTRTDISETWCDKGFASMTNELGFAQVRSLTLDQFEWINSGGECDAHADPQVKRAMELNRKWQADHDKWKAEKPEEYEAWKAAQEIAAEEPVTRPEYVIAAGNGEANDAG